MTYEEYKRRFVDPYDSPAPSRRESPRLEGFLLGVLASAAALLLSRFLQ